MLDKLSPRERQCLERAAAHVPHKIISIELNIEVGTIDGYLSSAARKLGVSRREALQIAMDARHPGFPGAENQGVEEGEHDEAVHRQPRFPWLPAIRKGRQNDLTPAQTLVAIVVAAALMLAAVSLFMLVIKIISLSS